MTQKLGELLAHGVGIGIAIAPGHVGDNAFEGLLLDVFPAAIIEVGELDLFVITAVQDDLADFFAEFLERLVHVEAIVFRQRTQHLEVIHIAPVPTAYRTFAQAQFRMGDHTLRIEKLAYPQAVTTGTGSGRVIEGKQTWLQFRDRVTALGAGEARREHQIRLIPIHEGNPQFAIGQVQGSLDGIGQPLLNIGTHFEPIDHRFDGVLAAQVQCRWLVQLNDLAIDTGADIALCPQHIEDLMMFTLAPVHHGGE